MGLKRLTAPVALPISLNEAKAHMRVDDDITIEDALIVGYISAATEKLDGRDGSLGRCLISQTWELTLDRFPSEVSIPLPPCQSITEITYVDPDGVTQTLAPTEYQAFALGTLEGAKVRPVYGKSWPTIRNVPDAVSLTFKAGFGDDWNAVPRPIRQSILMRAAHLFEHRESVVMGSGYITETPDGAEEYERDYKAWSF